MIHGGALLACMAVGCMVAATIMLWELQTAAEEGAVQITVSALATTTMVLSAMAIAMAFASFFYSMWVVIDRRLKRRKERKAE